MAKDTTIIDQIRAEIARQNITEYEIAKRAGINRSTVFSLNNPTWGKQIETVAKIAGALGKEIVLKDKKK
jgi:transcriptional regulator with XRE-family HTH domain